MEIRSLIRKALESRGLGNSFHFSIFNVGFISLPIGCEHIKISLQRFGIFAF